MKKLLCAALSCGLLLSASTTASALSGKDYIPNKKYVYHGKLFPGSKYEMTQMTMYANGKWKYYIDNQLSSYEYYKISGKYIYAYKRNVNEQLYQKYVFLPKTFKKGTKYKIAGVHYKVTSTNRSVTINHKKYKAVEVISDGGSNRDEALYVKGFGQVNYVMYADWIFQLTHRD